jgi:hypothetical protein
MTPTPSARSTPFRRADAPADRYPLTVPGILAAMVLGAFVGVWNDNLTSGYAVFVLAAGVSITWRRDSPPIIPFITGYQWTSITAGYWYSLWTGVVPGLYVPGDVILTVHIALTGLLLLTIAIRLAEEGLLRWFSRRGFRAEAAPEPSGHVYLGGLFAVVMLAYSVDYVYVFNPNTLGGFSSIVQRVLELRQVLLVTLWVEILRLQRRRYYIPITLAFAIIPRLGAYYSDFKTPLILMLIVLAAGWRPWLGSWWPRSIWAVVKGVPVLVPLTVLLLVWQGGIKRETREAYGQGLVGNTPRDRVEFFVDNLRRDLPVLFEDPQPFVETLVERISYVTFFSLVLERVPEREPHAGGELLVSAMQNAFVPRLLFPDKPVLPSDSYYTRRFAGIAVAEGATSVSIGYMAEFYADWGFAGMFVSVFLYGAWIGGMLAFVWRFVPLAALRFGAMTVVALAVADFEHQFIKGFAALNTNVIVMLAALLILRPWLARLLAVNAPPRPPVPLQPTVAHGAPGSR